MACGIVEPCGVVKPAPRAICVRDRAIIAMVPVASFTKHMHSMLFGTMRRIDPSCRAAGPAVLKHDLNWGHSALLHVFDLSMPR